MPSAQDQSDNEIAAAFAKRLGVEGRVDPTTGIVGYDPFKIAAALGVPVEDLFEIAASVEGGVMLVEERS